MFPQDLKEKYKDWYNDTYLKKKNLFESLAKEGQSPKYIIISCVDSRVDPNSIFKSEPGELLVHRNIANIVPEIKTQNKCTQKFLIARKSYYFNKLIKLGNL